MKCTVWAAALKHVMELAVFLSGTFLEKIVFDLLCLSFLKLLWHNVTAN